MSGTSWYRFRRLGVATALVAAVLATPGITQAAPAPAVAENLLGNVAWNLVRVPNPSADQRRAYDLITRSMNAAVARYNRLSGLSKSITVHYDPRVPTADGNINGTIRFGAFASMNERTALHEISHTIGVGTSGNWRKLGCGGTYSGARATALVKQYDGQSAVIRCDGQHYWPYGLNYDNEFSQTNGDRHVKIVEAMASDGL
jgi:hypothetical protein